MDSRTTAEGPDSGVVWQIEPHTVVKHELLREYLNRWLPIIGSWSKGMNYVDGFAGPGAYAGGEDGSPVIAIEAALKHKVPPKGRVFFSFIERDTRRADYLKGIIAQRFPVGSFPTGWEYSVETAEFEPTVNAAVDRIDEAGRRLAPTLAFVDPFGFAGFPMKTIGRILSFPHCEAFVTLMTGFITRFLEDDRAETLDGLFGSPDWRGLRSLSGDERTRGILELYQHGLKQVSGVKYARTFEIRDRNDRVIYHLVFATNHARGLEEMKEAMWAVDRRGTFVFSDLVGRDQRFLLDYYDDNAPHWVDGAANLLYDKFQGKTVPEQQVHNWMVRESPYVYRKVVLRHLERQERIAEVTPRAKAMTFPEGCSIRFLARTEVPPRGN